MGIPLAATALDGRRSAPVSSEPTLSFPPIPSGFEVLDRGLSPDGAEEVFVGLPDHGWSGVFLRRRGAADVETLWLGNDPVNGSPSLPVSVAWSPDGSSIAFVGEQQMTERVRVVALTIRSDGTGLRVLDGDLGRCWCLQWTPTVDWSSPSTVRVHVPNGNQGEDQTISIAG